MASMSHREFRTWWAWLEEQQHEPTTSDYYMMQIAGHVAHVMSKKSWKLDDYRVRFRNSGKTSSGRSVEEVTATAKAMWMQRAGISTEGNNASP